ncbi:MAG TPA: DUF2167 domain-containing protein [Flavobacteriales bacterium]|nr:DUF2167 domain-containing protein [Flavobacteriales bacterium]
MRLTILAFALATGLNVVAQDSLLVDENFEEVEAVLNTDSLEATFQYQTGRVMIADWTVTLELPDSLKYLAGEQARQLVVNIWGNAPSIADGMEGVIMYADAGAFDERSAFIVYSDTTGHVPDKDADRIDFDVIMRHMMATDSADNAERAALGLSKLVLIGWADKPFYDKERHALYWAKEMAQDASEDHVLNYNIRILGREGLITVNGLSTMSRLDIMKAEIPAITSFISYNDGFKYGEYKLLEDRLSGSTIATLIDPTATPDLGEFKDKAKSILVTFLKVAGIALVCMIGIIVLIVFLVRRKRNAPMS